MNGTVLEILNEKENKDAINYLRNIRYLCANTYWFSVVMENGYMWFNGSGLNVTYRNFVKVDINPNWTRTHTIITFNVNKLEWSTSLRDRRYCYICQTCECLFDEFFGSVAVDVATPSCYCYCLSFK